MHATKVMDASYLSRMHSVMGEASRVAWEAPTTALKMGVYSSSRYSRAVPSWELQAPDNCFNLSTLLQVLEEFDEACVLTVRKIHKIGLHSARMLREHFSQFGEVDRVMLLPSRPKAPVGHVASPGSAKVRPASMAFVVMRSRQPAIMARFNEIHDLEGSPIQVQKFRRDPSSNADESGYAGVSTLGNFGGNYGWLDDASTVADHSPPVGRTPAKMVN